jgi:hypothetical protein
MSAEIITTEDLKKFKFEILQEFKKLLEEHKGQPSKKWLKSYEVRKLLGISQGKLQNMRAKGTLPFTRIGAVIFYDYEDIRKMMEKNQEKKDAIFDYSR